MKIKPLYIVGALAVLWFVFKPKAAKAAAPITIDPIDFTKGW